MKSKISKKKSISNIPLDSHLCSTQLSEEIENHTSILYLNSKLFLQPSKQARKKRRFWGGASICIYIYILYILYIHTCMIVYLYIQLYNHQSIHEWIHECRNIYGPVSLVHPPPPHMVWGVTPTPPHPLHSPTPAPTPAHITSTGGRDT